MGDAARAATRTRGPSMPPTPDLHAEPQPSAGSATMVAAPVARGGTR